MKNVYNHYYSLNFAYSRSMSAIIQVISALSAAIGIHGWVDWECV